MARMLACWRLRFRRSLFYFSLIFASFLLVNLVVRFDKSPQTQSNDDYDSLDWVGSSFELLDLNSSGHTRQIDLSLSSYRLHWSVNIKRFLLAKPWFMNNGSVKASSRYASRLAIWPEEVPAQSTDPSFDRIVNQLMYVPPNYSPSDYVPQGSLPLKKILLYFGKAGWGDIIPGRQKFLQDKCPVNSCFIMDNAELIESADAVIFKDHFMWPKKGRRPFGQLWILFLLECPLHTQLFTSTPENVFNWTATYRHDSDIVAPYEKFVSYQSLLGDTPTRVNVDLFESILLTSQPVQKNYAAGKTKKVAWFVSNCGARNKRLEYARELSKYIEVDIFGSCGHKKCSRSKTKDCFKMLNRDYKFYLAFENSNCRDYITEKFFINSLGHNLDEVNILPIVMGGHPDEYLRSAPPHSYIHVDDFRSPAQLAHFLSKLDADDGAYNAYFNWKARPRKGEFINTYFWCRLCALLHAPPERQKPSISYLNMAQWWAPKNVCIDGYRRWPATQ